MRLEQRWVACRLEPGCAAQCAIAETRARSLAVQARIAKEVGQGQENERRLFHGADQARQGEGRGRAREGHE